MLKVCFNNDCMKIDLIATEPIFYNLLHESGYVIDYSDPDEWDDRNPIFKPKNENEIPKPTEVNINFLYALIQSTKTDFKSSENQLEQAKEFANKYGLLSATKNLRYYDAVLGNYYWYAFAKTGNYDIPFEKEKIKREVKEENISQWRSFLSGQSKPNKNSAVFTGTLLELEFHLGFVQVIYNQKSERIEHIPKTLGAALTLFHLQNHNKANKSCKECTKRFIDLTKPQKAKFCSDKCKSSNYRHKKVLEHIKKYHIYNEELDLTKTNFTDYKNNSLTIYCKERGKINISCEDFIQNPTYPE